MATNPPAKKIKLGGPSKNTITSQDIKAAGLSSNLPYIPEEEFAHTANTSVRRRNVLNVGAPDQAAGVDLLKQAEDSRAYMMNWVANRKVQDPEIQKEIDAVKPQRLQNLANTHIEVYKAAPGDAVGGGYNLGRNKVTLDLGFGMTPQGSTAETHEIRHAADKAKRNEGSLLTEREIELMRKNRTSFENLPMQMQMNKNYYLEPSEQAARIQALRKALNLRPDEVVTSELYNQRMKDYKSKNKIISQDVEEAETLFKGQGMINVLNNLSSNNRGQQFAPVAKGGIKLAKGGVMDAQGNTIDTNQIASHINDLQASGKLSKRESIRLQKGLMKINDASSQGVQYKITGEGTFTSKKDGKDIEGQASGLSQNGNFIQRNLEGRKVSKVMQLASGFAAKKPEQVEAAENTATASVAAAAGVPSAGIPSAGSSAAKEQPSMFQAAYQNPSLDLVANPFSMGKPGYTNPITDQNTFIANAKNAGASQQVPAVANQKKPATKTTPQNGGQAKPAQKPTIKLGSSSGKPAPGATQARPAAKQNQPVVLDLYTEKDAAKEKASQSVAQPANVGQSLKKTVAPTTQVTKKPAPANPAPAQQKAQPSGPGLRSVMNNAVMNQSKKYVPSNPSEQIKIRQQQDQQFAQDNKDVFEKARQEFAKNPSLKEYKANSIPNPLYLFSPVEYSIDRSGNYKRIEKKNIGGLALSGLQAPNTGLNVNRISLGKPGYTNPINNQSTFINNAKAVGGSSSPVVDGVQKMIQPNFQNSANQVTDGAGAGLRQGTGLRLLNAGLGLAGAISFATAKRPNLPGPGKFQSLINPATGMSEASKRFAQTQIAANTAAATKPMTSDARLNQQAKLQANYNANQALSNIAVQDAEMMRQDQMRVNQQVNQDSLMNFQNQQAYNQQKFALDNEAFQQRRAQGQQMVQSAINYENQRAADMANKRIAENTANNQVNMFAEQAIMSENANRRIAYKPQMTPEEEAAFRQRFSSYNTNNYQRPMRFKLGGTMSKKC